MEKIVYAGTTNSSFEQGSHDLLKLAEIRVSTKQVERVCHRIGKERLAERERDVSAYEELPLLERKAAPAGVAIPTTAHVAVVGCDGGRLQILDRQGQAIETEEAEADDGRSGKHWREDKIGLLMMMASAEAASDPCPEIPPSFVDPARILKLARELKTKTAAREEAAKESSSPEASLEALTNSALDPAMDPKPTWTPPKVLEKRMVGSRVRWPDFGPILAQAAWSWGFFATPRKAFIADGSDNNWTIWRRHFSSFEPILDFIHALSYVFASAMAARPFADGWRTYQEWIGWTWTGDVAQVIEALRSRQAELGEPLPEDGETHPRQVVSRSLSYLENHQSQMKYAAYRRVGLPITSSYVESAVKQFNQRVKGTEKFWSERGAEAMLQLRADHLSDHAPLAEFWQSRQEKQTGQRPYRMAS
ncbi:MAG: hypothetical protein H0V90_13815 [Blastocatellia bacterium]|nr:hypothetical protein [Blastocatellia bacterium]